MKLASKTIKLYIDPNINYLDTIQIIRSGWLISKLNPAFFRSHLKLRPETKGKQPKVIRLGKLTDNNILSDLSKLTDIELKIFVQACSDIFQDIVNDKVVFPNIPFLGVELFTFSAHDNTDLSSRNESAIYKMEFLEQEITNKQPINNSSIISDEPHSKLTIETVKLVEKTSQNAAKTIELEMPPELSQPQKTEAKSEGPLDQGEVLDEEDIFADIPIV